MVVDHVSFDVQPGEAVCVVGPNGGGKTTLFKLTLGLLQPDSGLIRVFDEPPKKARTRIGFVPQSFQFDPMFPATVLDVVLWGRLQGRFWRGLTQRDRSASIALLESLDLGDMVHLPFAHLSGGQRQRVLIARALSLEPELLLLDEPTANVDALIESKLGDLLTQLSTRMTILMISHDFGFVSSLFKKVICMNREVRIHPTKAITEDLIRAVYGRDLRLVVHDHPPKESNR